MAIRQYYSEAVALTIAAEFAPEFASLPRDVGELCVIVQGLLLHPHLLNLYGVSASPQRLEDSHIRSVRRMIERLLEIASRPLTSPRDFGERFIGNCRHFSLLLCAMLRHQGIPARARCGFGAYFNASSFEDHWVCEYWNYAEQRWVLVDAQLDAKQREFFDIPFDTLDVPRNQFIVAGQAWRACRRGTADPQRFGIFDMRGFWMIHGNLMRDLAALNRVELLPWDSWGAMEGPAGEGMIDVPGENAALFDEVAALTVAPDVNFGDLRELYESDDRLRVPAQVFNALHGRLEAVDF